MFGVGVGKLEWLDYEELWSLSGLDGQDLGQFKGVVASDKSTFSSRFTNVTRKPPPIGMFNYRLAVSLRSFSDSFEYLFNCMKEIFNESFFLRADFCFTNVCFSLKF